MVKDTKVTAEKRIVVKKNNYQNYQHYIGVDWSSSTMAIARINAKRPDRYFIHEQKSSVKDLQEYLKTVKGSKIVVVEESTPAHWLYVNLCEYADKVVICDPYKNRLLNDGPKTDPIDAKKLVHLLYGGLITEVYHSTEQTYEMRKLVSAYIDLVKRGVSMKNQQYAFHAQDGKTKSETDKIKSANNRFVLKQLDDGILLYETQKKEYEKLFTELCSKNKTLKCLCSVPGIAAISAVKILALTVDADRFPKRGKYLAYCGLVSYIRQSGGKVYGRKRPRFCRVLKTVYKTAALSVINGNGPLRKYYDSLLEQGMPQHNARHAIARYIARVCYGILKNPKKFVVKRIRKTKQSA